MTSQQDTELRDILEQVFHYGVGTNSSDIVDNDTAYLNLKTHAITKAIQALTSWKDKEVTKARIDELKKITKETIEKPITPENQNDSTWQGGYNFARNSLKRYKLDRIKSLQSQGGKNE